MKKRTRNKLLAIATAILLAAVMVVPGIKAYRVSAAGAYTELSGPSSVTFNKYLVIPENLTIPNLTFNFTVKAGSAVEGTSSVLPVYAGNENGKVSGFPDEGLVVSAVFPLNDNTTAGGPGDPITTDTTKKYATEEVVINLSNVKYTEPGIYRYVIEETPVTGVACDPKDKRTLDVYVKDVNGELVIDGTVMYEGVFTDTITTLSKSDKYINEYPSHNLYIGKKISGNQASKDKYFRFVVTLTDAGVNSQIRVAGNYDSEIAPGVNGATTINPNDSLNASGKFENVGEITTDTNETATAVFYLQGNQFINLMGLPTGAHYTVEETDFAVDGYTSASAESSPFSIVYGTDTLNFSDPVDGNIGDTDILTGFINTKNGTVPTGVILSVAPWAIAGVVILAGVVFFAIRSRKKYEEE